MRDIEKNIEFFSDEKYRDLEYGTIYYVPGVLSQEQKDLVRSRIEHIERRINQSENNWVTCRIVCLEAENPLFAPRMDATLYSALLPADDMSQETYAFLRGSLSMSDPAMIDDAFAQYFSTLQQLLDDVLDTGTYNERPLRQARYYETLCMSEECEAALDEPPVPRCEAHYSAACPVDEGEGQSFFDRLESSFRRASTYPGRLVITPYAYQVLIPDYDIEIHFTPQVKALYILFLNHPGGIRMSEIEDYKEEYMRIFFRVSDRSDKEWMRRSVERLIDVCNPQALNVKKSQCAEQLRRAIPNADLRKYYEIEVHRGQPHTINLDRTLVDMPDDLRL